jgi:cobalt-zinc-cadmium efflux system membrane fusion protein
MILRPPLIAACTALIFLAACSGSSEPTTNEAVVAEPLAGLSIQTAKAEPADTVPLGAVPGQITLPPEARVAVTAPYPGAAVRIYVIEGQAVRQGQLLALVRAAEPVQISGALARAQAELGLAEARARRLSQLASEGIIAKARADEADAALREARASVAESQRLAALGGVGLDGTMALRAPISGRVGHVAIETGGPVNGMTAPFVIENASAWQADLQLPERLARSVTPGMAVKVELARGTAPIIAKGTILSVAPSIDPTTRSVMAKARIDAAPGLVAGQNVMVVINDVGSAIGVSIPSSAIARIGGLPHVFVASGKAFTRRKVTLVAETGDRSILSNGLKPGEVVATTGLAELKAMAAE